MLCPRRVSLFNELLDLTGLVLTKLDGTAKGGIVIGMREQIDLPVKFVGLGESYEDVEPFDPPNLPIEQAEQPTPYTVDIKTKPVAEELVSEGIEDVPEDLKYIVAFYAVGVTFQSPVFLFKGYDRIVFYPHPFLSPNYPDHVHSCEVEHEDGTIIYSVEQLMASFFQPEKYYPIGGHPFAEILTANPASNEKIKVCTWKEIESISGFSKESIDAFIGLEQTNSEAVSIVLNLSGHLS